MVKLKALYYALRIVLPVHMLLQPSYFFTKTLTK